jgi:hypothetical protein
MAVAIRPLGGTVVDLQIVVIEETLAPPLVERIAQQWPLNFLGRTSSRILNRYAGTLPSPAPTTSAAS